MFDSKSLTEEQLTTIKMWVEQGAQLADIQQKMDSEFGQRMTYMDTRFLVLDLGLQIKVDEPEQIDEATENEGKQDEFKDLTEDDIEVLPHDSTAKTVTVTVDDIARPDVMASGRVTFSDSQGGMWYIDQMGRLGIDPDTEGYSPSEADVLIFQKELQRVVG